MVYLSRRLTVDDTSTLDRRIDEAGILTLPDNKIVLGEPGMGKSELMRELGRRISVEPVAAIRFINAKNPTRLVQEEKPLLIDGLDEAMSRREGDAVDAILAQLEEAGAPPFVISCRSREWQARSIANLRQLYGAEPKILTLEPFNRSEALAYLLARYPKVDAEQVLDHLTVYSLEDLYRNPLTLGLMGRVAESDAQLPASRGALFERVCTLVWPEHDADRQDLGLSQLTQDEALDAAGAIAAGLLFAGAEAASAAGAAQLQEGDLRLADLERLPHAEAARVVFTSKLFHSVGALRAKPIHRVVSEYLGARWLARRTQTPRTQRRVLAQLHGSGSVPASLRGLHAWLAYHSAAMAERVISADPYGVLRYGETTALTPRLADRLFDALCALADDDPYFRAADWDSKTAAGLMIPALKLKINSTIELSTSSEHLRSLLIEGLEGSPLAAELGGTLEAILLSPERFYRERYDAAEALLPHRDRSWWRATIATLTNQRGDDAPRLARQLIERIDADVSDDLLVATVFAEMELTSCPVPRVGRRHRNIARHYDRLIATIPSVRLINVLDLITDYAELLKDIVRVEVAHDVADVVTNLLVRAIDEGAIGPAQASSVWRWLEIIEVAHSYDRNLHQKLAQRLAANDAIRQAIQAHVLEKDRRKDTLWATEFHLQLRLVGLSTRVGDIVRVLNRLASGSNKDPVLREDWKDLVRIGWGTQGPDPAVWAAAEEFQRGDKPLGDFVKKLQNPKKPAWQIRRDKEAAKRARKRKVAFEMVRRKLRAVRDDLRAGKLEAVLPSAKAYFDHFNDLSSELSPGERLAEWIGPALRDDALVGFEAVLHRIDLPTAVEVAEAFAQGNVYNYSYPLMAGLYERMRTGRGIGDLSKSLKRVALLLCFDDHGWSIKEEKQALCASLEAEIIPTQGSKLEFARLWIEPALSVGNAHIAGLYKLGHDSGWQPAGTMLAREWLKTYPNLPESVEGELVDCLTRESGLDALRDIAEARAVAVFRNIDHMLSWLAIDVLVRFEVVQSDLKGIAERNPEFLWFLRDRLQFSRRGKMLSVTVRQAEWIVAEFRGSWVYSTLEGSGSGDTNGYDATDFLKALISRIADDTSVGASDALQRLIAEPDDSYSKLLRHMAAEQRQKRAEENFSSLVPSQLGALLDDGPPGNIEDLRALVLEEMDVAQHKLLGDDLDPVSDFWTDVGIPRDENRCRDRLAGLVGPELSRYGIQRITEADMPMTKRADLAFAYGSMQLPLEVKGQWHKDVWDAAANQLSAQYLIDWRSEQRGIYCVLWFGEVSSESGRRLKPHPDGDHTPANAGEMRTMLIARMPESIRAMIDVVVVDLTAGKR